MKISLRQKEVLWIIRSLGGSSDGWGEIWTHYDTSPSMVALDFRNFDRVCDALKRKGLVIETNGCIDLSAEGKKAVAS